MKKSHMRHNKKSIPRFWYWHCKYAQNCLDIETEKCRRCNKDEPKVFLPEELQGCLAVIQEEVL